MKKLTLVVARDDEHGGQFEVSAWALDVPGLAAWNNPGKFMDVVLKKPWCLMHIPSGMHVDSAFKRDELVDIANALADIDWTQENIPSLELAHAILVMREWWAVYYETIRLADAA